MPLELRRHEMIDFYYNLSPNPMKVALFLEEARLPYEPKPVDTRKGEQFLPNTLQSIPMRRSQPLLMTVTSSSIVTRYSCTLPKRADSFFLPKLNAASFCLGSCLSPRALDRSPVRRCISST